jgi:hypothetical protein
MNEEENKVIKLAQGEVYFWPEGASLMIKAITKSGDPVELCADEAKELAELLTKMAKQIE